MFEVLGFYKFINIRSLKKNKILLQNFLFRKKIRGTIIIANEGLNGTISGDTFSDALFEISFIIIEIIKDCSIIMR